MLPSKNRLTKKPDFERVKAEGELLTGRLFGILFIKNEKDFPRVGFIVSTNISKKAVERNRAKRLLREATRVFLPKIKGGVDVLFLAKSQMLKASQSQAIEETKKLFKKGGLVK